MNDPAHPSTRKRLLAVVPPSGVLVAVVVLAAAVSAVALSGVLVAVPRSTVAPALAGASGEATPAAPNLLVGTQATFSGTTGGWVGENAGLSWASASASSAQGSLAVKPTGSGRAWACSGLESSGDLTRAIPGALYTGVAALRSAVGRPTAYAVLGYYDSGGAPLVEVWGQGVSITSSGWTTLPAVTALAPATAGWSALCIVLASAVPSRAVFLEDPDLSAPPSHPQSAIVGPLRTSGNRILDAAGMSVLLRGVVLNGLESSADPPGVTHEAVSEAKAWGANFVRVPLGEQLWMAGNCDHDPTYPDAVDAVVNWITSLGMVALLDLDYTTVGGCEVGAAHDMADAAQSPEFWAQVAARYAGNPLVAFDLFNEPHAISDATWLDGGATKEVYAPFQSYRAAGMQQMYYAVRSTGAQNLVFVSGNNWANTVPGKLVQGRNIVYAAHAYTCPNYPPPRCSTQDANNPAQILENFVSLSASVPVVVTEFGWPSASSGTYNANVIDFASAHDWGWSAFAWEPENWGGWDLAEWSPSGSAEPNPSGAPVLKALQESP
ncbi:MAG: glycoside hydrolase family 5 protein [Acidimicrobiales bacterium]